MSVRIPVSLKFDTNSDVYNDFILELKNSRELSPLCVDLLTLFYEDDEVRELITFKREANDPLSPLRAQLEQINIQHTKNIMATNMVSNRNRGIISSLENEGMLEQGVHSTPDNQSFTMTFGDEQQAANPTAQDTQQLQSPSATNDLMQRMENLERMLPNILNKLDTILSGGVHNIQPEQAPIPVAQPAPQPIGIQVVRPEVQSHPEPAPVQSEPVHVAPTQAEPTPVVSEPVITPPTMEAPTISVAPPTVGDAPQVAPPSIGVSETEETPKKPASFGKALKSIKKK